MRFDAPEIHGGLNQGCHVYQSSNANVPHSSGKKKYPTSLVAPGT